MTETINPPAAVKRWPTLIAWTSLLVFAATGFQFPDAAFYAALCGVAVVVLCYRDALVAALWSPLGVTATVFALYVLLRSLWRYLQAPEDVAAIAEWTRYYLVATGLPAIFLAVLLAGERRRVNVLLGVALLALLVQVVQHLTPAEVQGYLTGERAFFALGNAAGLYLSAAALGVFVLLSRQFEAGLSAARLPVFGALVVALLMLGFALGWHQNRTALLAACLVFPPALFALSRRAGPSPASGLRKVFAVFAAGALLAALLLVPGGQVAERMENGVAVLWAAIGVTHDDVELPQGAVGERVRLWSAGWNSVTEHPIAGSGPGSVATITLGDPVIARHSHLHNLYLQLLVELGLPALLLYGVLLAQLLRLAWRHNAPGSLPPDLRLFAFGSLMLFLLINLGQVRIDGDHAMFFQTALFALVMTYPLTLLNTE